MSQEWNVYHEQTTDNGMIDLIQCLIRCSRDFVPTDNDWFEVDFESHDRTPKSVEKYINHT